MDSVKHGWLIGLLGFAFLFILGAVAEWYTVVEMSSAHWLVFWLLIASAGACLVAVLFVWRWGRWPIAWLLRRKTPPSDPMLESVIALLDADDAKWQKATKVAESHVPSTPLAPRIARLEELLSDGKVLSVQVRSSRHDEVPHYAEALVSELCTWRYRVMKSLSPWREFAWFSQIPWSARVPEHGQMDEITLNASLDYLRDAIAKLKTRPPIVADIRLLKQQQMAGGRIQTGLENNTAQQRNGALWTQPGEWWNATFDALIPWPRQQTEFPEMKSIGEDFDQRFDLGASLNWLTKFIAELEGATP